MKIQRKCQMVASAACLILALAITHIACAGEPPLFATKNSRPTAPNFPPNFAWLNTDRPLQFTNELRGRIVVLDFWTYACINCMHMIPVLREVEEHYKNQPVTVIGVHSNKFENEAEMPNIRSAVLRYQVEHPVVVDESHQIWDAFGIRAWPTFVFIDAEGRAAGMISGERDAGVFIAAIDTLLAEGRKDGTLNDKPLPLRPEAHVPSSSGLMFPGKVAANASLQQVFIADSGHHRIIAASFDGQILNVFGSGEAGLQDGPASTARFNNPQGIAVDSQNKLLFVADTNNHALRQIDLASGEVRTLAGTGKQGYDRAGGKKGTQQPLASPWDVALEGNRIFIAMAGTHQIWTYDRASTQSRAWAGSGAEQIFDGPANRAALAQPSGLSVSAPWLYFADSETSSIRRADLKTGEVTTLIGTGLFDFGDGEGLFAKTQFQHPLAVAANHEILFVADTYNHKIKRIDLEAKQVMTVVGGRDKNSENGNVRLYEPGGLSLTDHRLFIADTNNHRVVIFDTETGATRELTLHGWLKGGSAPTSQPRQRETIDLPIFAEAAKVSFQIDLKLPAQAKINPLAPMTLRIIPDPGEKEGFTFQTTIREPSLPTVIKVPLPARPLDATYHLDLTFAYCTEQDANLCAPVRLSWRGRIATSPDDGSDSAVLRGTVAGF